MTDQHNAFRQPGLSIALRTAACIWIMLPALLFCSCIRFSNTYTAIPPGIWRATLILSADSSDIAEERSGGLLPFNFEVEYIDEDTFHIVIRNGDERIVCTEVGFGQDRRTARDTIRFVVPPFGTYVAAQCEEDAIEGHWYDPSRGEHYRIPFRAYHGQAERFRIAPNTRPRDFSGQWEAAFSIETEKPYRAIGIFEQEGSRLTGTFLLETGDYRYLEGNADTDRLYLSVFDGSHAYLFEAKMQDDGTLSGIFRSGNHYKTYWTATRTDTVSLADPYAMTMMKEGMKTLEFSFPNTEGRIVTLNDPQFAGKPKVVMLFGTWCPNCLDETQFVLNYIKAHPNIDLYFVSLAFERHTDREKALQALRDYKRRMDIPWEILYAGSSSKQKASEALPMLSEVLSFPTMMFLDKENRVVKIHTGFYGPATAQYTTFQREFDETVKQLTQ